MVSIEQRRPSWVASHVLAGLMPAEDHETHRQEDTGAEHIVSLRLRDYPKQELDSRYLRNLVRLIQRCAPEGDKDLSCPEDLTWVVSLALPSLPYINRLDIFNEGHDLGPLLQSLHRMGGSGDLSGTRFNYLQVLNIQDCQINKRAPDQHPLAQCSTAIVMAICAVAPNLEHIHLKEVRCGRVMEEVTPFNVPALTRLKSLVLTKCQLTPDVQDMLLLLCRSVLHLTPHNLDALYPLSPPSDCRISWLPTKTIASWGSLLWMKTDSDETLVIRRRREDVELMNLPSFQNATHVISSVNFLWGPRDSYKDFLSRLAPKLRYLWLHAPGLAGARKILDLLPHPNPIKQSLPVLTRLDVSVDEQSVEDWMNLLGSERGRELQIIYEHNEIDLRISTYVPMAGGPPRFHTYEGGRWVSYP